jgi:hypothetical protein
LQALAPAQLHDSALIQFKPRPDVAFLLITGNDATKIDVSPDARSNYSQKKIATPDTERGDFPTMTRENSSSVPSVENSTTERQRWIKIALHTTEIAGPALGIIAATAGVASCFSNLDIRQARSLLSAVAWSASGATGLANSILGGKGWQTHGPFAFDVLAGGAATISATASDRENPNLVEIKIAGITSGSTWTISGSWKMTNEAKALYASIHGKSLAEINKLECAEHLVGIVEGASQAVSGITDVVSIVTQNGTIGLISDGIWLGAEGLGALRTGLSKGGSGAAERRQRTGNPQSVHLEETGTSHAAAHSTSGAEMQTDLHT